MTTSALPADLWTRAERPESGLSAHELARWPSALCAALERGGALVEAGTADAVACPACDTDHVERVEWVRTPAPARAFVSCPESGPVRVEPDALRQWSVRPSALAALVANVLGARGGVAEPVPGRVWKLGTVRAGGAPRAAFLALGTTRPDAPEAFARVPELALPNALVLVPAVPPATVWGERAPAVIPLADALAVGAAGLEPVPGALEVFAAALAPMRKGPARTFPAPAGATWDDVALTVEEHRLHVSARGETRTFGFAEAGFEDRRKKNVPDAVWVLLRVFARCRGTLATRDLSPADRLTTKPAALKAQVGKLRAALSALIGIEGNPFHPTARGKPYRARFAVKLGGAVVCPLPAGATWDALTLTGTATGVEVSVTADARGTAFAEDGTREGCTDATEREFVYTFDEMGCSERAERALRAVLAGRGRVTRRDDDAGMLALGAALTAFFGISDAPPFEYDRARGQWVATFEALPEPAER